MAAQLAVGLVPGATVGRGARGRFVRHRAQTLKLGLECPPWAVSAVAAGTRSEDELIQRAFSLRGYAGLKALYGCLTFLRSHRLVGYTVVAGQEPLATWIPDGVDQQPDAGQPRLGTHVALSRFAYARRDGDAIVLESPLASGQLILHGPKPLRVIGQLNQPRTIADAVAASGLAPRSARQFLGLLWRHHFVTAPAGNRSSRHHQQQHDALDSWEFHDLLFHARSRHGRHRNGYGARPQSALTPVRELPAPRPRPADIVRLPRPDMNGLRRNDIPFTAVLEDRRTRRAHSVSPMTIGELGEFLYRTVRARRRRPDQWRGFDRVAPTGGAVYELDAYLAIQRCRGARPGLYRYDPIGHALWRRAPMTPDVRRVIAMAGHAARTEPQVLIIVSARFGRTLRRYASMGYAMILKDTGVLFQTFYLVATAMGLAPCAIGGGDSDDFARAARTQYYEETSVGEFLLGRSNRSSSEPLGVPNPVHGSHPRRRAR
jgi:SagB-type dehydrogenase family enzyme